MSELKLFARSALLHSGLGALCRLRLRGRVLVLAYHNVVREEQAGFGDASLHLPIGTFRTHLDALEEEADVVPLSTALSASGAEPEHMRRPRVVITFDDAYRGAVNNGLPEVTGRGMPVTMFVSPGRLNGRAFWWDRYAGRVAEAVRDEFREVALLRFGGREGRVEDWARRMGWQENDLPTEMHTADEGELIEAARLPGVTLASHAWSHPNLVSLTDDELKEELSRPLEWLMARCDGTRRWLAYPYGRYDQRVADAAAAAGYEAALRVEGGWLPEQLGDRFSLPRLNVPAGLTDVGFRCRLAGLP